MFWYCGETIKKKKNRLLPEIVCNGKIRSTNKPASFPRDCGITDTCTPAYDVKERAYTVYTRTEIGWRNVCPSPSVPVCIYLALSTLW